MGNKFRHNKLEQHRGLLLQVSIIISLLIVLAAFNYKSKNSSTFSGDFVEINFNLDTISVLNSKINKPLPEKPYKPAEFKGGKSALTKYIKQNLHYPEKAMNKDIQGRIYVKFTVNRYGKIQNAKIARSIHPLLDREAMRLVKNMPDWTPAKKGNETVESEQILPVIFMSKNQSK